jgi:hypothetical protein
VHERDGRRDGSAGGCEPRRNLGDHAVWNGQKDDGSRAT